MALHTQDFEYVKTNQELKGVDTSSQLGFVNSQAGIYVDQIKLETQSFYLSDRVIHFSKLNSTLNYNSGKDDDIHPTYQHYRSSGSLLRNKEFHMRYANQKIAKDG